MPDGSTEYLWEFDKRAMVYGKPREVISVRAVKRIPEEHMWWEDCVSWVSRAPWNRYKEDDNADGDLPQGVPAEEKPDKK